MQSFAHPIFIACFAYLCFCTKNIMCLKLLIFLTCCLKKIFRYFWIYVSIKIVSVETNKAAIFLWIWITFIHLFQFYIDVVSFPFPDQSLSFALYFPSVFFLDYFSQDFEHNYVDFFDFKVKYDFMHVCYFGSWFAHKQCLTVSKRISYFATVRAAGFGHWNRIYFQSTQSFKSIF